MATPMVEALRSLGHKIDFLIHPSSKVLSDMVSGFKYNFGTKTSNTAVIPALWRRCLPGKVAPSQVVADDLNPNKHHESEANMTAARKLGFKGKQPKPKIYGVKSEVNSSVVIAPGCRPENQWRKKKYPYWKKLCKKLSEDNELAFLGTKSESQSWMKELGKDLCGQLRLSESINYVAGCRAVIAIDNGIAHIAAALGKKTVVLWGPTILTKNKPVGSNVKIVKQDINCQPCQLTPLWNRCDNYKCMQIDPEQVIKVASL